MLIILNACGGLSDAGKVLRNEKTRTTDEFLVKKRDPLILPPDYSKLPVPDTLKQSGKEKEKDNEIKNQLIKRIETRNEREKNDNNTSEVLILYSFLYDKINYDEIIDWYI